MSEDKNKELDLSSCCSAPILPLAKQISKKTSPGVTSYYYHTCEKCTQPCHYDTVKIWDCAGDEIKNGDLVEAMDIPAWHAERWHACYLEKNEYGQDHLEIRDLGNNNRGMYSLHSEYYTRGHYSNHLDKLSDEDLDYYWNTTREEASKLK